VARDLLAQSTDTPRPIAAIARAVGISPFHFIRQFEAVFGATPHQFRIARRIDRAAYLLALDGQSVTDVCMEVGCSSLGSFSTLFARRVGVPPSRCFHTERVAADDFLALSPPRRAGRSIACSRPVGESPTRQREDRRARAGDTVTRGRR